MFIFLLIFVITLAYFLCRHHFSKWQRMGLPTDEPVIPFGSMLNVLRKKQHFGFVVSDIYEKFQHQIVGLYMFNKPTLLVRDAALARQILTSDFASFHDRGLYVNEQNDPMSANLFTINGQQWRKLRTKLTPTFSSGNLRRMFDTIDDVADKLIQHVGEQLKDGKAHTFEMKNLFTTYAVDIIGSVIFGLDIDSFSNPDNEFRQLSDCLLKNAPFLERFRAMMNFLCPPISKLLARLGVRDPITYRLRDIVQHTIEFREKNGVVRKDLLQSLIELKKADEIDQEHSVHFMSIDRIAANAFLFYIAGSDTTAATIAFTIYELAMYPDLLVKAQQEVDECMAKHNLKPRQRLTYEFIQDLKFMDLCIMETTRKYPGLPFLNRECTKDFPVPGSKLTIRKGTGVIISLLGIHRDEQYFPQAMDFKPERFAGDNKDYDPVAFMPFGEGPRHCIAQRLGVLNVKAALSKILASFNVVTMPRKEIEFAFHTAPILEAKDGIQVALTKRW